MSAPSPIRLSVQTVRNDDGFIQRSKKYSFRPIKNQKESNKRYYNRNKIPLCEVPKDQLYDVYVFGKKME